MSDPVRTEDMGAQVWEQYIDRSGECWIWTGAKGGAGMYGIFTEYLGGGQTKTHVAHRWVYEKYVGSIPEDHHLHHTCSNNECVNPEHLEVMTALNHRREHTRGVTHCKHGHPFDEENTYINTRGQRECKECRRQAVRKWRRNREGG